MKKNRLLLTFLFCVSLLSYSQNKKRVDSLNNALLTEKNDSLKADILLKIWKEFVNSNTPKSLEYANKLVELGKATNNEYILADGYMKKGTSYGYMSKLNEATKFSKKALFYFKKQKNNSKMGTAYLNIAVDKTDLSEYKKAKKYLDSALVNYTKTKDSSGLTKVYSNKFRLWFMQGYYKLARKNLMKSIEIAEDINDEFHINKGFGSLAQCYSLMKDTINAEKIYKKVIKKSKEKGFKRSQYQEMVLLASMYENNVYNFNKSQLLLNEAIPELEKLKDQYMLMIAYKTKGLVNYHKKQYKVAIKNLNKSLEISRLFNNPKSIAENLIRIGDSYIELNNPKEALKHAREFTSKYNNTQGSVMQLISYNLYANIYKKLGNLREELKYQKLITETSRKIDFNSRSREIEELQIIYETSKKENEIALKEEEIKTLNAQAKNDKLTKTLFGIGMFSFLAISGLIYFGFKQRIKKNKIEQEKQEAILKQKLEFKKKELTSQTLHLVQKNTFIQELKENLERIKKSPELFKVEFRRLVLLLKKESAEDKDWEVFKSYFSEVHNNFDEKIKSLAINITEKEIRLASFLRMNLSTKEIASMFNVLPESVLKSKYRLKKKLGLAKEQDLNNYLNTF
ncbi:tetratricopeptide repeat protein [uncultured Polaribacter sp.]|uniref:tetratricopeptide repeat protein n=1 Tax=uncultured Polaribacter sp. TaxID=174711 RepID=UPI00259B7B43|nr:tetratricopeptide repeat protein [uncultured Polaribacter sp.]